VRSLSGTHHTFSAASASNPERAQVLGVGSAEVLSGSAGDFTSVSAATEYCKANHAGAFAGSLVGVYATSTGGAGTTKVPISRW